MTSNQSSPVKYEYDSSHGIFTLTEDGHLFRQTDVKREVNWFKDGRTRKPMIPAKRRSFVSLIKMMIRGGDFDA